MFDRASVSVLELTTAFDKIVQSNAVSSLNRLEVPYSISGDCTFPLHFAACLINGLVHFIKQYYLTDRVYLPYIIGTIITVYFSTAY